MKKPSIFKPFDVLFMLLPCFLCASVAVATFLYPTPLGAKVLMTVVTLCFMGIYATQLQLRYSFIASYPLKLACNVHVRLNGYKGTAEELNKEITGLIGLYSTYYVDAATLLGEEPVWVEFLPDIITINGQRVAGYTTDGNVVKVSYYLRLADNTTIAWAEAPVDRTAFAHELAHVVIGRATGSWSNEAHHAIMKKIESLSV